MKVIADFILIVFLFFAISFSAIIFALGVCGAEDVPVEVPPIPEEYRGGLKP